MDTKEVRRLRKFVKKVVSKKIYKKIKSIKNQDEKLEVIKYSLKTGLEIKLHQLKQKIKEREKKKKDVFYASTNIGLLESKIKLFNTTFHKKDFEKVLDLFKKIEKELKNV